MIKDFSFKLKRILLVWLLSTVPAFAQPNSPFSEGEQAQGKHYQNLWIGGGFNAGGMDFLSNGNAKIYRNVLFHGTNITWGLQWGNTTLFEEEALNLFIGNVPKINIGTKMNESYLGGEVFIAGEGKLTSFGGGIYVAEGIQFNYYLDILSDDDIPEGHPAEWYTSGDQPFSYLTTDANILDLFRDSNITSIYLGGVGTEIRIGGGSEDDFIISPSQNSISSAAVGGTVHLFNDNGVNVQIGAEGKSIEVLGNLVVHGTYNFLGHNVGPYDPNSGGAPGTGGVFTGMWPTHYEGAWKITFTAETPQIRSDTNEYTYLFSEKFTSSYFTGGDPFLGVRPDLELDLTYRTGLIIGNVSDVSIGNPNRITRIFGTVYFDGAANFVSGVTWEDVVLSGTTTFKGPITIVEGELEEDDRLDYRFAVSVLNEGEGEWISEQDPSFESSYETNPSFDAQKGLVKIVEALDVTGGLVRLTNLPTEEPTGAQNAGALWIDEGEGVLMVASGISAPIPKLRWYYVGGGEGEPYDLIIYGQSASERSPDDEGEGEIFDEGMYPQFDFDTDPPDLSMEGDWAVFNFGPRETEGEGENTRNDDGGITITYTIGKEILGKLREDSLIIELLPPHVESSIEPNQGSLPLFITISNDTIEGPIEAYSWSLEVYSIGGEGENEYLLENEGEISEFEFYLLEAPEGEGEYEGASGAYPWYDVGTISAETDIVFRLIGTSLVNEAYADVSVTLYPTVE